MATSETFTKPVTSQSAKPRKQVGDRQLLTVKELAVILRLSLQETYKLLQSLAMKHFRVGPGRGSIRIEPGAVDEFLKRKPVGASIS
ncbi:MAG: helix-turn-helix domain-containing protein [Planctomycetales bacterium]|nr:helix-turn-helix domain-containing protein [Planctomycetales bacterium]